MPPDETFHPQFASVRDSAQDQEAGVKAGAELKGFTTVAISGADS